MSLSNRIKEILKETKLNQKKLAEEIGTSPATINALVKGTQKSITKPLAMLIELRYGFQSNWIEKGKGKKKIKEQIKTVEDAYNQLLAETVEYQYPEARLAKFLERGILAMIDDELRGTSISLGKKFKKNSPITYTKRINKFKILRTELVEKFEEALNKLKPREFIALSYLIYAEWYQYIFPDIEPSYFEIGPKRFSKTIQPLADELIGIWNKMYAVRN